MKALYDQYIQSKSKVWSQSALRSERCRLTKYWDFIDGNPDRLWKALSESLQPYARATYWTRVCAFWEWLIKHKHVSGPNPYKAFREDNVQCFRNVYTKKPCPMTFEEAEAGLLKIKAKYPDYEDIANKLLQLLHAGLRRTESYTLTQDGFVTGKGGKVREVFVPEIKGPMALPSRYSTMLKVIKKELGITPHKLRSIRATTMNKDGADIHEMTAYFGWSSINTAQSYVATTRERLQKLARREKLDK